MNQRINEIVDKWKRFFQEVGMTCVDTNIAVPGQFRPQFQWIGEDRNSYIGVLPGFPKEGLPFQQFHEFLRQKEGVTRQKSIDQMVDEKEGDTRLSHIIICGSPGMPTLTSSKERLYTSTYMAVTITSAIRESGAAQCDLSAFAMVRGGTELDIWPVYWEKPLESYRNWSPKNIPATHLPAPSEPPKDPVAYMHAYLKPLYSHCIFNGWMPRFYMGDGVEYNAPNLIRAYNRT